MYCLQKQIEKFPLVSNRSDLSRFNAKVKLRNPQKYQAAKKRCEADENDCKSQWVGCSFSHI